MVNYKTKAGGVYVELPFRSSYILNVQNYDDNLCFVWSVLAHYYPVDSKDHPYRVNKYKPHFYKLNLDGITFPISYDDIKKFNKNNPNYICNVYELTIDENSKKCISSVFHRHNNVKGCNLFYYNGHYVLCRDMSIFLKSSNGHKGFPCLESFGSFSSQAVLDKHLMDRDGGMPTFPTEKYSSFKKYHFKNKVPFTMYADFEAWNSTECNMDGSERIVQKPLSFGIFIRSEYPDLLNILLEYTGLTQYYAFMGNNDGDTLREFVRVLLLLQDVFYKLLKIEYELHGNDDDVINFNNATKCYYCERPFYDERTKEYITKNRDHDHYKQYNNYRGAACTKCNLQAKNKNVPLFFHNGSRYDNHLIFVELMESLPDQLLKVLPVTEQVYISFDYGCIRILDSYRFMGRKLDELASWLKPENCINFNKFMGDDLPNVVIDVKKGIYPYDYITGDRYEEILNKMCEPQLPPREAFFNKLSDEELSKKDYKTACDTFKKFGCNNLYDYTMIYMKMDILLLADVFENFRNSCLENYSIDPCYCYSTPGLTWQAGLRYSKVNLLYYKDDTYDKLLFYEEGVRGGFSSPLGNRIVKCYNKEIVKELERRISEIKIPRLMSFDTIEDDDELIEAVKKRKENKRELKKLNKVKLEQEEYLRYNKPNSLHYYDANSLYPTAMVQELPTGESEWSNNLTYERTTDTKIIEDKWIYNNDTGKYEFNPNNEYSIGYVYEVDLHYPNSIKERTRYYPLCPEKKEISPLKLTDKQTKYLTNKYKSEKKLICTQNNKYNYIIEGRMLDFCLEQGMEIRCIHKKLVYKKSAWLKSYIEFNITKRKEAKAAKDKFGIEFFKLMNNAFYGKTLENVRNRQNIVLVNNIKSFKSLTISPRFKRVTIFPGEKVAAVHSIKKDIYFDKFNYVGFTVLELSKLVMYRFVYDILYKTYGDKFKLHYTDTDSVFIELLGDSVLGETHIDKIKHYLDDSELGKFKDELGGEKYKQILKAVFVKSKMYAYDTIDGIKKRMKGISKCAHRDLRVDNFEDCILNHKEYYSQTTNLISDKHTIEQKQVYKKMLDGFYDKGLLGIDGIETLPFGYFDDNYTEINNHYNQNIQPYFNYCGYSEYNNNVPQYNYYDNNYYDNQNHQYL